MAQFKRVWLPYITEKNPSKSSGIVFFSAKPKSLMAWAYPTDDEKTEKANTKIQNLITQGWRIVSTAPVTGSLNILHPGGEYDLHLTFTTGIEVFMVQE